LLADFGRDLCDLVFADLLLGRERADPFWDFAFAVLALRGLRAVCCDDFCLA
jgi:hypothetical protein